MGEALDELGIRFGVPAYGWLPVTVRCGPVEQYADVSDVPVDTLRQCVLALECLAAGSAREAVRWHLEPAEWLWVFERVGQGAMAFRSECPGFEPIETRMASGALLKCVVRALLAAGGDHAREWTDQAWSWPFPEHDVEKLREHILGQ